MVNVNVIMELNTSESGKMGLDLARGYRRGTMASLMACGEMGSHGLERWSNARCLQKDPPTPEKFIVACRIVKGR